MMTYRIAKHSDALERGIAMAQGTLERQQKHGNNASRQSLYSQATMEILLETFISLMRILYPKTPQHLAVNSCAQKSLGCCIPSCAYLKIVPQVQQT